MKIIIDLCVVPMGEGVSVSSEVKRCVEIIRDSGLSYTVHGYGTNIEGDWDEVFAVVKKCHEALHAEGVVRISSTIKLGSRTDKEQTIEDKIVSVS